MRNRLTNSLFIPTASILTLLLIHLPSEGRSLFEDPKEKNELIGPVHQTITKDGYYTTTETYDRAGNLIEMIVDWKFDDGESRSHYVFTYDDRGLPKETLSYDANGAVIGRKRFGIGFNEQEKPVAIVATGDDESYMHSEFGIYDKSGNLAEKIFFAAGFTDKVLFDALGNMIYAISFRGDKLMYESVDHYNLNGELEVSLYYNADGSLQRKDRCKYNQAGRKTEERIDIYNLHGQHGYLLRRYELDDRGNWIRQTEQSMVVDDVSKPLTAEIVRQRKITYY